MIINTGMRTDIPAFYSKWFINRIREGYVLVRNPYNPEQITRYNLNPQIVDMIGFCTKNPAPMLKYMDILKPYGQYWFVSITPYGREIEPHVPEWKEVVESFRKLSEIVGIDSMGWRYDPIFISETYTVERHLQDFEQMASKLAGYTKTCVISFIDIYSKVSRNFPEVTTVFESDRLLLGKEIIRIANEYGMTVKPCAEGNELEAYGADCSGCMTLNTYETALHCHLDAPKKKGARKECACYLACDIGAYNTCGHQCRYCYANYSNELVRQNMQKHNLDSPLLIGDIQPEDVIHQAEQKSWKDMQMSIFDCM